MTAVYAYTAGSVAAPHEGRRRGAHAVLINRSAERPKRRRRSVALGAVLGGVVLLLASAFVSSGQEAVAATASRPPTSTFAPSHSAPSTSPARTTTNRPAGWTSSGKPSAGVVFRPRSTTEDVIITASTSVAKLPTIGHATSISRYGLQQVVACGVSGYLYSFRTGSPHKFYADAAFSLAQARPWAQSHSQLPVADHDGARFRELNFLSAAGMRRQSRRQALAATSIGERPLRHAGVGTALCQEAGWA